MDRPHTCPHPRTLPPRVRRTPRTRSGRRLPWPLVLAGALGALCCARVPAPVAFSEPQMHLGEAWWTYRAQGLGITPEEAMRRDAALSTEVPPHEIWDTQTAAEARALWAGLCARCHGLNGDLEGAPPLDPPPRDWSGVGPAMGFFFGGDRMRAGLYRRIAEGGASGPYENSSMPAWGESLSREQIWALVFFLEEL